MKMFDLPAADIDKHLGIRSCIVIEIGGVVDRFEEHEGNEKTQIDIATVYDRISEGDI
jgi:hypothetical protein